MSQCTLPTRSSPSFCASTMSAKSESKRISRRTRCGSSESFSTTTSSWKPSVTKRSRRHLAVAREHEHLREVERLAARAVLHLRPAGEPVRDDERVRRGLTGRGEQRALAAGHGHVVVLCLVPPRAGQAATARVERLDLRAHPLEQLLVGRDPARRLVVAVPVEQHLARQGRGLERLAVEELAEVEDLLREPLPVLVVRKQLAELVLEH